MKPISFHAASSVMLWVNKQVGVFSWCMAKVLIDIDVIVTNGDFIVRRS